MIGKDGRQTASYPDGSTVNLVLGPDPRWRMQAPIPASLTVTTTGGLARTTTTQRVATLTTPGDLLSLRSLTETVTVNGTRTYRTTYDGPSRTLALTSPEGRPGSAVLDARGRVVQKQLGNLAATTFAYDARGRIEIVTQGTGPGARVTRYAYGTDGLLASVTDPVSRTTSLAKDAAGRLGAAVLFALAPCAQAATWYVASNGIDGPAAGQRRDRAARSAGRSTNRPRSQATDSSSVPGRTYGDLNGNGILGEAGEETPHRAASA